MAGIKRYRQRRPGRGYDYEMFEDAEGEWCKFADIRLIAQAAFQAGRQHEKFLQTQVAPLKEEPIENPRT